MAMSLRGRWAIAIGLLVVVLVAVRWRSASPRAERRPAAATDRADSTAAPADAESPDEEWRLEVEIRDPDDRPIAGRVYVLTTAGERLSVLDNEPDVPAIHRVRGTVDVIARELGSTLAPRFVPGLTPPATGLRRFTVRLETGLEISGTLVDEEGKFLDRLLATAILVEVEPVDAPWLMHQRANALDLCARGEQDATFKIVGLPPGQYRVRWELLRHSLRDALLAPGEPVAAKAGASDVSLVVRRVAAARTR